MSRRRFHTKSRYGCLQCKHSRKKCDENRPQCGRCEKAGQHCSLSDISSSLMFISTDPTAERFKKILNVVERQPNSEMAISSTVFHGRSTNTSPADTSSCPSFTSTSENVSETHISDTEKERLRLMHHYTLHTAKTLAELSIPTDRDQTIWSDFAVDLALEHDLVLHGLLSLSALHLALRGIFKQRHTILAIHHHDLGLAIFRTHLTNITSHNYDSIFAFTCIVMLYAFGIQRCSESTANTIAKVHQILTLISNSRPITKSHMDALRHSRWSVMMMSEPYPTLDQKLPDDMEAMLAKLAQRVAVTAKTASQADVYNAVVQSLRYILILTSTPRPAQVTLVIFPMLSPREYWDMMRDHDPLALAVLANYAVTLHWLRYSIWLEGWGKETVDAVHATLPPEWHDCINWAVEQTRL
ncbi:conserved hypothetical protein [Talaromyces stipitatus ATCC 10500]|uniref:Zn(2)-C6 fungal-type domain-containing protein n=1 Tax=Talaromyces stipitatus (strain ATCC 10500 / CBS 375.48 / QM 6759 / NRRL 1006) TaxID=441959 RepID=B8MB71_TALSN|nr:uncharacterized protein TSTA_125720 [Talaromyces stipitatus ATCC 10500]EED18860.1 conserved hypothetical protein [Talaromyces stipitatus ATCC 10500]